MLRRSRNVERKKLLILSRSQKCWRFKASRCAPDKSAGKKNNSLSNLKNTIELTNPTWVVLTPSQEKLQDDS